GHPPRDIGLHPEDVGEGGLEGLLPVRGASGDRNQLRAHPNPARCVSASFYPPDGAGEEIVHAELPADLLGALGGSLVPRRAAARRHLQALEVVELHSPLVGQAVSYAFITRITALHDSTET